MSKHKPKLQSGSLSGERAASFEVEHQKGSSKVPFATTLDSGLYKRLKVAAALDDTTISDIVGEAIERELDRRGHQT